MLAHRRIRLAVLRVLVLCCLAFCWANHAVGQDLSPRAYLITPVGTNVVDVNYSYLEGGLQFNGAAPITGAQARLHAPVLSYYRSFGVLGRAADFTVAQEYGFGSFKGTVADVPKSAQRSGFLDIYARLAVNLIGGPAMDVEQFGTWHQTSLLGASLEIVAPTGQYDPARVINYGNNRWGFKPELGYSKRWGRWVLDAYGGVWFFTPNRAYYPGKRSLSEAIVGAVQLHLSHDFIKSRMWVSLDANDWRGGETSLNGVANLGTNQKNSRVGITAAFRITRHQSVKLSFSEGAYISYGGNYRDVTLAWQYAWVDPSRLH